MARPTKQGIDYFPIDTCFDDKTEMYLLEKEAAGLAVLVTAWQLIYSNEGYYSPYNNDFILLTKKRVNVDINLIDECIMSAISRGIFDENLFNTYRILTSRAIQKRFFDAAKRKKSASYVSEFLLIGVNEYKNLVNVNINSRIVSSYATNTNTNTNVKEDVNVKEDEERDKQKSTKVLGKPKPSPSRFVDSEFLTTLKQNTAYQDLDLDAELGKCQAWCLANTKSNQPTRKRFVNWINRAYGGRADKPAYQSKSDITKNSVKTVLAELEKQERSHHAPTIINPMPR